MIRLDTKKIPEKTVELLNELPAKRETIEKFIEKTLRRFARRELQRELSSVESFQKKVDWQFYINHFFFVERGDCLCGTCRHNKVSGYLALFQATGDRRRELAQVQIKPTATWCVTDHIADSNCSISSAAAGWQAEIPPDERAVIGNMIEFLFERGFITVVPAETDDETEDEYE